MSAPEPGFELHARLAADCFPLADLGLSRLLLMNDARYPWCILVPRRNGIREIHELDVSDQRQLLAESSALGRAMMTAFSGFKLNVAALGNLVPQLHLHHVVRFETDAAWPGPVWGRHPPLPYADAARADCIAMLKVHLTDATWND